MDDKGFEEIEKVLAVEPEMRKPNELVRIQEILLEFDFFQQIYRDYHVNNIVDCAIYFKYQRFVPGDCVFTTGQPAQRFFLLLKGGVTIYKQGILIRKYSEGSLEECCLVERKRYDVSAMVTHTSHVIYIDYQIYSGLFLAFREKRRVGIASFLRVQPEFKQWTIARLMSMSYFIHELKLAENSSLYEAGDVADRVFIVLDGSLILKDKEIKTLTAGDVFGIEDVIIGRRRSRCVSQSKSTILYVFKADFMERAKVGKKEVGKDYFKKTNELSGLSIYSFAPEVNMPIKLMTLVRPNIKGFIRPNSQLGSRSHVRGSYSYRPNSSLRNRSLNLSKIL